MKREIDILIVGAGSAGIAAAVAAVSGNMSVMLIDKAEIPGGKATGAAVGTICGLFPRSLSGPMEFVHSGFPKEFSNKVMMASSTRAERLEDGLGIIPYDPQAFQNVCRETLEKAGIEFYASSTISSLKFLKRNIQSAVICCGGVEIEVNVKAVIDCSGSAILADLLGIDAISEDEYQSSARVFGMSGVDSESIFNLNMGIRRVALMCSEEELKPYLLGTSAIPGSLRDKKVLLKIGMPEKITDDAKNTDRIKEHSEKLISQISAFLQKNTDSFRNSEINFISSELGVRIQERLRGNHILTEEEVQKARKSNEGIARGTWPIEIWKEGYKISMDYLPENDYYEIPAGCLESVDFDNLFMAGRGISAEPGAIASARVIGTCLATGSAAGMLAAGMVSGQSREESIAKIRSALFANTQGGH